MNGFEHLFWRRFWKLLKPYWKSEHKWAALRLVSLVALLSVSFRTLSIVISYASRDLMTALSYRDQKLFFHILFFLVLYNLAGAPIAAFSGYLLGRLINNWRLWLTERFLEDSFYRRAFYRICTESRIDNPDQRISEDLNSFTAFAVTFGSQVLEGAVSGVVFLVVLWSISQLLTIVLVACIGAGSLLTVIIGHPLIPINFNQRRREADFRYGLVGMRDNAEAIALYGGERYEQNTLLKRLRAAVENYNLLIAWQRNLAFFTYAYDLLLPLLPLFILAPAFFDGKVEFGKITQASMAIITVHTSLSIIVAQFNGLSNYAAVVERLGVYIEACENVAMLEAEGTPDQIESLDEHIYVVLAPYIAIESLTLKTPDLSRVVVRNISLETRPGERLLITGKSGAGKTSLLRAISGLWQSGSGRILRPSLSELMFLPQRPYMIPGSLRDQLCYPQARKMDDDKLHEILEVVNLGDLVKRVGGLDAECQWKDLLSLGEQQEIAFARVLLRHPTYVFLDEASSAIDAATEQKLYQYLSAAQINIVSVGDQGRLMKYHDKVIELLGDGKWRSAYPMIP